MQNAHMKLSEESGFTVRREMVPNPKVTADHRQVSLQFARYHFTQATS